MKKQFSEKQIQQQIMNLLRMKGYYVMRMNSGKYSVGEGSSRRFIKGHEAGTPDVMAFKKGVANVDLDKVEYKPNARFLITGYYIDLLFVEVKAGRNKPTTLQTMKMKELEEYGAKCLVAYSVEDVEAVI